MGWSGVFSLRLQAIRRFGQTRFDDVKKPGPWYRLGAAPFLLEMKHKEQMILSKVI
jgi:hypothetical protein